MWLHVECSWMHLQIEHTFRDSILDSSFPFPANILMATFSALNQIIYKFIRQREHQPVEKKPVRFLNDNCIHPFLVSTKIRNVLCYQRVQWQIGDLFQIEWKPFYQREKITIYLGVCVFFSLLCVASSHRLFGVHTFLMVFVLDFQSGSVAIILIQ